MKFLYGFPSTAQAPLPETYERMSCQHKRNTRQSKQHHDLHQLPLPRPWRCFHRAVQSPKYRVINKRERLTNKKPASRGLGKIFAVPRAIMKWNAQTMGIIIAPSTHAILQRNSRKRKWRVTWTFHVSRRCENDGMSSQYATPPLTQPSGIR